MDDEEIEYTGEFGPMQKVVNRLNNTTTPNNISAPPEEDGTYTLQCTVADGVATYAWV